MNRRFVYITSGYIGLVTALAFYYTKHYTPIFVKMAEGFDGINHLMRAMFTLTYAYYGTLYFVVFKKAGALFIILPLILFPVAFILGTLIIDFFKLFSHIQEVFCSSFTYCILAVGTVLFFKYHKTFV